MNTENSMIRRIEALPEARKNTILETMWLLGKLHSVDDTDIETLIEASEYSESKCAKEQCREGHHANDIVLVEGVGTMTRVQASTEYIRLGESGADLSLRMAHYDASMSPAYKE